MTQHMLTANRLSDGAVVFLQPGGGWSGDIRSGQVLSGDQSETLEAEGRRGAAANIIVAPYVIEVTGVGGNINPVRRRERIRAFGPTVVEQNQQSSPEPKDVSHVPV